MQEPMVSPHVEARNELELLMRLVSRGKIPIDAYLKEQQSVTRLAKAMKRRAERMRKMRLKAMEKV